MFQKNFMPGPTQVRPEILAEMARPPIHHRGPAMKRLLAGTVPRLRDLFGVERESGHKVVLTTSSSTAMMEAAMLTTVPRGGRVLNLICGAFSERWHEIARRHGREAVPLRVEWGAATRPEDVRDALSGGGEAFDAVTLVHNETSTGVLNPLAEIAEAVHEHPDVLLLVDAVSSLGGAPVEVEKNGIDVCLSGSQKCLALPPGLGFGILSPGALHRAGGNPDRGFYLDLLRCVESMEKGQLPFTASSAHLLALDRQLRDIGRETWDARYERHRRMAAHVRGWAGSRFSLLVEERYASPTVTVVEVPPDFNLPGLYSGLENEGVLIAGGYGKLRENTFRIGHMGDWTVADVVELTDIIDQKLEDLR
jgi:predicted phosphoserine aminotransferase